LLIIKKICIFDILIFNFNSMATKRVVGFLDVVDEIPERATWLYSRKLESSTDQTEESEAFLKRALAGGYAQYIHYFEVDDGDFEELVTKDFFKTSIVDRLKKFIAKNKLQTA
jgi:hypothetical protein